MAWVARLSHVAAELRVVYCTRSPASRGTRAFLEQHYARVKELNPGLPVYVRPCDGVAEPYVAARYARGAYERWGTAGMGPDGVLEQVRQLVEAAPAPNAAAKRAQLADVI